MILFWLNRIAAIIVAGIHVYQVSQTEKEGAVVFTIAWLKIIPLSLIWFAEQLSWPKKFEGPLSIQFIELWRLWTVDTPTPAILFKLLAWGILLWPWLSAWLFHPVVVTLPVQ